MKAHDNLLISQEHKLKRKVTELTEKQDEISLMRLKHEKEMKEINERMDRMYSIMQANPKLTQVKKEVLSEI